jgi:hypothetical protein
VPIERLYLITMSVLILHQIDAAYWKEWEMFYLPGGIQGFLLFNILAIPFVLVGYGQVIKRAANAKIFSYICGSLGIVTFLIHASFTLLDVDGFNLPLSILLIILCLVFGTLQVIKTKQTQWQ